MAPKRKSDTLEPLLTLAEANALNTLERALKKPRASDATDVSSTSSASSSKDVVSSAPRSWRDIKLEGEDDRNGVTVYDDCGQVRRKIRLLQKTPGWKVTEWLSEIGINSNSYGRFMRERGKFDGSANGTYYAAYVYFEKVRIFEGKKKTASRKQKESSHLNGLPLEDRRRGWVFTG